MSKESPWYKDGLRFQCTECGKCCTGQPGYVWVSEEEMQKIADHLQISLKDFKCRYTRLKGGRYALLELPKRDHDCIFLKDNKCSIYPVRPKQCRTFPWWKDNLKSPEAWKRAAVECEGINEEAPLIAFGEIQDTLNS